MDGRTIRLFLQPDGLRLGLMPVSANEEPGTHKVECLDDYQQAVSTEQLTILDANFDTQDVKLSKAVEELRPAPGEYEIVAELRNTVSETRFWSEPFERPVPGCRVSPFGVRRLHNGRPTGNYHAGIDQRGAAGTPVRAVADGVIRIVRPLTVQGNMVGIDHGQGLTSQYLHLSSFAVTEGSRIAKGDVIAYVGSTGRSTAPHLHWSLTANGVAINPEQWVSLEPCPAPPAVKRKRRRGPRRR